MQRDVSDLRDLRFERRVPVTVESPGKLAKRLLRALAEETDEEQLRRQGRAMVLLGQLPQGTDLPALVNRVQAESVLGFYLPGDRPPKGGLYVRSSRGLDPYAKIILAHELTAVTDQRFDLTLADRLAVATARQDELAAYSGLVEGDALTMERYLTEKLTPAEQAPTPAWPPPPTAPQRDAAPAVIRESMLFPYQEGLRFVRALYQQGGWDAVNRAYRDPPDSTEQVLHPERYLGDRDRPQAVEVADLSGRLGGGWRSGVGLSFGELDARLLLQGELAVTAAGAAAASGTAAACAASRGREHRPGPADRLELHRRGRPVLRRHARLGQRPLRRLHPGHRRPPLVRGGPETPPSAAACLGSPWLSAPDVPTLDRLGAAAGSP